MKKEAIRKAVEKRASKHYADAIDSVARGKAYSDVHAAMMKEEAAEGEKVDSYGTTVHVAPAPAARVVMSPAAHAAARASRPPVSRKR